MGKSQVEHSRCKPKHHCFHCERSRYPLEYHDAMPSFPCLAVHCSKHNQQRHDVTSLAKKTKSTSRHSRKPHYRPRWDKICQQSALHLSRLSSTVQNIRKPAARVAQGHIFARVAKRSGQPLAFHKPHNHSTVPAGYGLDTSAHTLHFAGAPRIPLQKKLK